MEVENQPRVAYKGSSLSRVIENQYFNEAFLRFIEYVVCVYI